MRAFRNFFLDLTMHKLTVEEVIARVDLAGDAKAAAAAVQV